MPQAVDLPVTSGRSSKQVARSNRSDEPSSRFDDILSSRSRTDRSGKTDASREASEVRSKKSDRPEPPDPASKPEKKPRAEKPERDQVENTDEPPAESEAPVTDESSESSTPDESETDQAAVVVELIDIETDAGDADADAADPSADAAVASLAVVPTAEKLTGEPSIEDAVEGDPADPLDPFALAKLSARPVADGNAPAPAAPNTTSPSTATADPSTTDADADAEGVRLPADLLAEDESPDAEALTQAGVTKPDAPTTVAPGAATAEADIDVVAPLQPTPSAKPVAQPTPIAQPQQVAHPDDRFVEQNVDRIVTGIKSDLTPNGGSMKIRLDPPNLGQLNIDVTIDDGVLTASFQTSNDEATRLLSHSMQQLKHTLEAAGVTVERIQVRQASSTEQSSQSRSGDQDQQQQQGGGRDHPERQEQQRREMLQKMWAKLALGEEPLDLVA